MSIISTTFISLYSGKSTEPLPYELRYKWYGETFGICAIVV